MEHLLISQDTHGMTFFHGIFGQLSSAVAGCFLEELPFDMVIRLLMTINGKGRTPMMCAASNLKHEETIWMLVTFISRIVELRGSYAEYFINSLSVCNSHIKLTHHITSTLDHRELSALLFYFQCSTYWYFLFPVYRC